MPAIARLQVRGLRGLDFDLDLARDTYVTGPHGSGKTTVTDALRFVALGYVPRIGRTEQATARLMSGRDFTVTASLADGSTIQRSLTNVRGRYVSDAVASWIPVGALKTEHSEAIIGLFGRDAREAEENLDFGSLLGLSSQQRAKRLEEILDGSGAPLGELISDLGSLTVARVCGRGVEDVFTAPTLSQREADAQALLATLPEMERGVVQEEVGRPSDALRGGKNLAEVLEATGFRRVGLTQTLASRSAARREIEDRIAAMGEPTDTVDGLQRRRQEFTDRIATLRERARAHTAAEQARLGADSEHARAFEALEADGPALQGRIDASRNELGRLEDPADYVAAPPPLHAPSAELLEARRALEAVRSRASSFQATPKPREPKPAGREALERLVASLQADLDDAERDPWREVHSIAQALLVDRDRHSFGSLGDRLAELADANGVQAGAIHARLHQAQADLAAWDAAAAKERKRYDADLAKHLGSRKAWDALQEEVEVARSEVERLEELGSEAYQTARSAWAAEVQAGQESVRRVRQRRLELGAAIQEATEDLSVLRQALKNAQARREGTPAPDPFDVDAASEEVARLDADVAALDRRLEELQRADARRVELESLTAEILRSEASMTVCKAVEWSLQRMRERDLGSRGEPILARMRAFFRAAGVQEEPYFKAEAGQVDFGWVRGQRAIHVSAMSAAEAAVFQAALASAVVSLRKASVRLLLFEASEAGLIIDRLCCGAAAMREVDNVVMTSWVDPDAGSLPAGWSVVRLPLGR